MKRHVNIFLAVVSIAFILWGCATSQSVEASKRSRIYNADYATVLKAAVDYCNNNGYAILTVDKDLGILNTDYKSNSGVMNFLGSVQRLKFNLSIIKLTETQIKIIAIISWQQKKGSDWQEVPGYIGQSPESKYNELLDGIESNIPK
ncbi:MAG: hypothetical protein C0417_02735 [Chlorobiaceae bacterium]|nr:hypothetical protein [Chlorobiaceae bacterium]